MSGYTLHYDGVKFGPGSQFFPLKEEETSDKVLSQTDKLAQKFSNIGALVIRYHIGQGQRVGMIQQVARVDYELNPVQKPAPGADQEDLFERKWSATPTCIATAKLEKCAHQTLGRGKVLNERAQPLIHINREKLHGEQNLWDRMHSSVWHTGINFAAQLDKQGFVYICCPQGLSEEEDRNISRALFEGNFATNENEVVVLDYRLATLSPGKLYTDNSAIQLDPQHLHTSQLNGFVINVPDKGGMMPLGWMMHEKIKTFIPVDILEDIVRIIRISKGGFYELNEDEQKLLQSGRLKNSNGLGLFEQNQAFNAIYPICSFLEKTYGFDPEKIFGASLTSTYNRVAEFFKEPENVEDFLTGPLLTEMVQSLRVSRALSTRKELPLRFTNPFIVTFNNAKAIAYAFNAQYKQIPLLLADEKNPVTKDNRLIDVFVNGELALPSLSFGKHSAAILATAMLVAEQMLLEHFLRNAVQTGDKKQLQFALSEVMGDFPAEQLTELIQLTDSAPRDLNGPILGLQFDHCDKMISVLRKALGFNTLIQLVEILEKPGILTDEALNEFGNGYYLEDLNRALICLYRLGELMQKTPGVSAHSEGSKGINAGLGPLIKKISPTLLKEESYEQRYQMPNIARSELSKKDTDKKEAASGITHALAKTDPLEAAAMSRKQVAIRIFAIVTLLALMMGVFQRLGQTDLSRQS